MDLAWISLAALLLVIVASCTTRINAGALSIALAWIIGLYVAPAFGNPLSVKELVSGFPADLFLTLTGVTLLFSQAQANGTLDRVARFAVKGCRGNVGWMPVMFFALACALASIGAGNIAASALMAPLAMAVAHRAGIPAFLMSVMVSHGAIAGGLSPFSPTGIIAGQLMRERMQLSGFEAKLFLYNLGANALVAAGGFLLFGGWRLFGRIYHDDAPAAEAGDAGDSTRAAFVMRWSHWVTLVVIAALIVGVVFFGAHVGMGAFAGSVVLTGLRAADEKAALARVPWGVIVMVTGVTVLTALLERTGGLDRFAQIVSRVSTPQSATGVIALLTGLISVYSSTSGVVLPTFLPMVPKLIGQLGGGDPFALACSVIVGGHLVDSSPLSTIGALCIASSPVVVDRRTLFNQMLIWGLSMAVVGAAVCYVFFGLLKVA